jgi:hypothetical protein
MSSLFDDEPEAPRPCGLALLVCDHVHVDSVSKLKSLLGLFVHRRAEAYPVTLPLCFYFSFCGAAGGAAVRLRLAAPGGRLPDLLDFSVTMHPAGDEASEANVRELMVRDDVTFPAPGAYLLEAYVGGEVLMGRPLYLHPGRLQVVAGAG